MQPSANKPTLADLAFSGRVLPRITDAVRIADACHRAALSLHRVPSATLAGKDASSQPLREQHQHAHYVPDCRGPDPARITHLLVYAPRGFAPSEVAALAGIRDLPPYLVLDERGAPCRIEVSLVALGHHAELRMSALCRRHSVFVSRTPFILPRHRKRGDEPEDQLLRELHLRGLPPPVALDRTQGPPATSSLPWSTFRHHRKEDETATGFFGFRIKFAEPVAGPILLGRNCHFGLGQFVPHG